MISLSYTDKSYIKMIAKPWKIDLNYHHQNLKFKENKENYTVDVLSNKSAHKPI